MPLLIKMLTYNFLCARHSSEHFPSIKFFKLPNNSPESGTIIIPILFYKLHRVNWHNQLLPKLRFHRCFSGRNIQQCLSNKNLSGHHICRRCFPQGAIIQYNALGNLVATTGCAFTIHQELCQALREIPEKTGTGAFLERQDYSLQ